MSNIFIERLEKHYEKGIELSEKELRRKNVIDFIISLKINNFAITDKKIIDLSEKKFGKHEIKNILTNITIAERVIVSQKNNSIGSEKAWARYFVIEAAKEAYQLAKDKGDSYSMIMAANTLGKHAQTDKDDTIVEIFEQIVPFLPVITTDPSILGMRPIKQLEQTKQKLKKKYLAVDVEYEEFSKRETDISE